eukprot:CFRG8114T1
MKCKPPKGDPKINRMNKATSTPNASNAKVQPTFAQVATPRKLNPTVSVSPPTVSPNHPLKRRSTDAQLQIVDSDENFDGRVRRHESHDPSQDRDANKSQRLTVRWAATVEQQSSLRLRDSLTDTQEDFFASFLDRAREGKDRRNNVKMHRHRSKALSQSANERFDRHYATVHASSTSDAILPTNAVRSAPSTPSNGRNRKQVPVKETKQATAPPTRSGNSTTKSFSSLTPGVTYADVAASLGPMQKQGAISTRTTSITSIKYNPSVEYLNVPFNIDKLSSPSDLYSEDESETNDESEGGLKFRSSGNRHINVGKSEKMVDDNSGLLGIADSTGGIQRIASFTFGRGNDPFSPEPQEAYGELAGTRSNSFGDASEVRTNSSMADITTATRPHKTSGPRRKGRFSVRDLPTSHRSISSVSASGSDTAGRIPKPRKQGGRAFKVSPVINKDYTTRPRAAGASIRTASSTGAGWDWGIESIGTTKLVEGSKDGTVLERDAHILESHKRTTETQSAHDVTLQHSPTSVKNRRQHSGVLTSPCILQTAPPPSDDDVNMKRTSGESARSTEPDEGRNQTGSTGEAAPKTRTHSRRRSTGQAILGLVRLAKSTSSHGFGSNGSASLKTDASPTASGECANNVGLIKNNSRSKRNNPDTREMRGLSPFSHTRNRSYTPSATSLRNIIDTEIEINYNSQPSSVAGGASNQGPPKEEARITGHSISQSVHSSITTEDKARRAYYTMFSPTRWRRPSRSNASLNTTIQIGQTTTNTSTSQQRPMEDSGDVATVLTSKSIDRKSSECHLDSIQKDETPPCRSESGVVSPARSLSDRSSECSTEEHPRERRWKNIQNRFRAFKGANARAGRSQQRKDMFPASSSMDHQPSSAANVLDASSRTLNSGNSGSDSSKCSGNGAKEENCTNSSSDNIGSSVNKILRNFSIAGSAEQSISNKKTYKDKY